MSWLGVRCWKDKIAVVVVADGTPPTLTMARRQPAPTGAEPGVRAAWFANVVSEAIDETGCNGVAVRVADNDPDQARAEAEGAVLAAGASAGLPTKTFRRQSLVKPLGVPAGAGAWKQFQKDDSFVGAQVGDEKDAVMASLAAART